MVSEISSGWSVEFGKFLTIMQRLHQPDFPTNGKHALCPFFLKTPACAVFFTALILNVMSVNVGSLIRLQQFRLAGSSQQLF